MTEHQPAPRWADLPTVESVAQLESYGIPEPRVRDKVEATLHEVHREWIAASPLVLVATSSADGRCDVSPKGDSAGLVHILDERTLALPGRRSSELSLIHP